MCPSQNVTQTACTATKPFGRAAGVSRLSSQKSPSQRYDRARSGELRAGATDKKLGSGAKLVGRRRISPSDAHLRRAERPVMDDVARLHDVEDHVGVLAWHRHREHRLV